MNLSYKNNQGFSLAEIIIACAIITTCIFALMTSATKSIQISRESLYRVQSSFLLEEGAEAVKAIRDASWNNISALNLGENYYLTFNTSTNTWFLNQTPTVIDSLFTRTVVISAVNRNVDNDIASSGTLDTRTKKVTIVVSWPSYDGITKTQELPFYISDIFN